MTLSAEELVFKARALAQSHPFTQRAQAYLNATIARERTQQPVEEIGVWAGYCISNGYCLRRVEEDLTGNLASPGLSPEPPREAGDLERLDLLAGELAEQIRTERADFLLFPEGLVVDALDRLIGGEVERRLSHWAETIDEETFSELEEYLAWWTIKGYALRVAERLVGAQGR